MKAGRPRPLVHISLTPGRVSGSESAVSIYRHEQALGVHRHESVLGVYRHEPALGTDRHEQALGTDRHELKEQENEPVAFAARPGDWHLSLAQLACPPASLC